LILGVWELNIRPVEDEGFATITAVFQGTVDPSSTFYVPYGAAEYDMSGRISRGEFSENESKEMFLKFDIFRSNVYVDRIHFRGKLQAFNHPSLRNIRN